MMKSKNIVVILFVIVSFAACKSRKQPTQFVSPKQNKENFLTANKGLVALDQDRIKQYVERKGWEMKVSETGMWYQVVEKNSEQNAQPGQVAHLWYVMELLDGTVAHSSANEGDLKFRISQGGVESGLEEAILMLGKGDKARFILPPHLAHGLTGDLDKIPPRASIVYSIKVLDITSN